MNKCLNICGTSESNFPKHFYPNVLRENWKSKISCSAGCPPVALEVAIPFTVKVAKDAFSQILNRRVIIGPTGKKRPPKPGVSRFDSR